MHAVVSYTTQSESQVESLTGSIEQRAATQLASGETAKPGTHAVDSKCPE